MDNTLRKAAEMALDALEKLTDNRIFTADLAGYYGAVISSLRQALAQPEQEPVARFNWNKAKFEWLTEYSYDKHHMKPLYLAPPSKPWVSLTDEEINDASIVDADGYAFNFAKAIEAALRSKNENT